MVIKDFLKHHNIPYPAHLAGWEEYEHVRILRFKGDINSTTIPKILKFKEQMEKAGLPLKNVIFDGKKVTDIDTSAVAALLSEVKKDNQMFGLINPPAELKSHLEIFHKRDQIKTFDNEEEAIAVFNQPPSALALPAVTRTLKKNKCLSLLFSLILFLVALPFFEANMMGILYLAVFTFVMLAGIYAVSYNMRHVAGGFLLAMPTLVTAWSNIFIRDHQVWNAQMVFLLIFLTYTITVILKHVLSVKKVSMNELYAALSVYIMVGMTFGVVYALLYSIDPGSISFPPGETAPRLTAFFYFSFVSMSSTGFSGFAAVSPFCRAVVIVQVIMGIMYMSAFLGKLMSSYSESAEGPFDEFEKKLKIDIWYQELAEDFFRKRTPILILSMAMLNYASSVLMTVLNWPFFMDSWGTSLAVMLGGLSAGIWSGVIYNLVMAFTFWEPTGWVWMFCNILIAFLTALFVRWGWVDLHKPGKLLLAGIIAGVLNSIVVAIITHFSSLPVYQGTMVVYHFFVNLTGNPDLASIAEKMAVEVADKTMSLVLVAVATIFVRDFLNWTKKNYTEPV